MGAEGGVREEGNRTPESGAEVGVSATSDRALFAGLGYSMKDSASESESSCAPRKYSKTMWYRQDGWKQVGQVLTIAEEQTTTRPLLSLARDLTTNEHAPHS